MKFRYIQLIVEGSSEVFQLQHHSLAQNSRTFQDLPLKFPGLSRTKPIFQDFPGPGNFTQKNPGLSRRRGNPDCNSAKIQNSGKNIYCLSNGKRDTNVINSCTAGSSVSAACTPLPVPVYTCTQGACSGRPQQTTFPKKKKKNKNNTTKYPISASCDGSLLDT